MNEWTTLVGPQLAGRTRPGRFERKTPYVFVTSSVWLSELSRFGKGEILRKIQSRFGKEKIRDIRLQIDPDQC